VLLAGTGGLLGVKRPSLNVRKFRGVSMRLLRREGAISDELLGVIDVGCVDTGATADEDGAVAAVQVATGVGI
jgi:hypothetical protein